MIGQDIEFTKVIEKAREECGPAIAPIVFSGTVAGFMIATGVKLAHDAGAPRHVLEAAISERIRRTWEEHS